MRDRLKFRVWSKRECKYVEYHLDDDLTFAIDIDGKLIAYASDYSDHANCDNGDFDDSHMVEQCTGLKDKNSKLIYEGDIVEVIYNGELNTLSKQIYPMLFNDKVAKFGFKHPDGHFFYFTNDEDYSYEVIGNIHKNPELLEEYKKNTQS